MNIVLSQQNYRINDLEFNSNKIINDIKIAKKLNVDLIVFSELCLTGYPPQDIFFNKDYFNYLNKYLQKIIDSTSNISVLIGSPSKAKNNKFYNSAIFIQNKKIKQYFNKTLLPEYDIFIEKRYFVSNKIFNILKIKNKKIAVTICEDIWFDKTRYNLNPLDEIFKKAKIDFIINLSASPFDYKQIEIRNNVLIKVVKKYKVPLFYCNAIGSQTNLIFDGNSLVLNSKGNIVYKAKSFDEDFCLINTNEIELLEPIKTINTKNNTNIEILKNENYTSNIYNALILGIKDYFIKTGFKKAIIGASGGIDSALVQALTSKALGKENVVAILMPSKFSSNHSVIDAEQLSINLKNEYHKININNEYETYLSSLKNIFNNEPFSLAEENLQSRIRGTLLMAIANKKNYVLLNTSNKSEISMGYGTLYGDMAGGLSILGDLFKTQVYALANFINKNEEIIPNSILTKEPSAELRPNQKDSDSLPNYEILDTILYDLIHLQLSGKDILYKHKFNLDIISKTIKQYHLNEYKRFQFCPILRISNKSFGIGRKMEIVSKNNF